MEPLHEKIEVQKENNIREIVKFTLIALVIFLPLRFFVIEPFLVVGTSMDTTFGNGQYLMVDQVSYHFHDPSRDDVIIFKYPASPEKYLIKRIIGLPGETVISDKGKITIQNAAHPTGFPLNEDYVLPEHRTFDSFQITLGPTEYFVMGDNRGVSSDSRIWGPLESKYIVGRPVLRLLPLSKIGLMPGASIVN